MRINPKDLGRKRKETKKRILEALCKIGVQPDELFDAIERSDREYDICIGKNRFAVEIEEGD